VLGIFEIGSRELLAQLVPNLDLPDFCLLGS
jgi:hypothetical protein